MTTRCDFCAKRVICAYELGDSRRICLGCIGRVLMEFDHKAFLERWRFITGRDK